MIGARGSALGNQGPQGISNEDAMPGVWFSIGCAGGENGAGAARLNVTLAVSDVLTSGKAIASGRLGAPLSPGDWHTLRIIVMGATAAGFVDGAPVFAGLNISGAPSQGWVGIGTPRFGDFTQFDRIRVNASAWRCSVA